MGAVLAKEEIAAGAECRRSKRKRRSLPGELVTLQVQGSKPGTPPPGLAPALLSAGEVTHIRIAAACIIMHLASGLSSCSSCAVHLLQDCAFAGDAKNESFVCSGTVAPSLAGTLTLMHECCGTQQNALFGYAHLYAHCSLVKRMCIISAQVVSNGQLT